MRGHLGVPGESNSSWISVDESILASVARLLRSSAIRTEGPTGLRTSSCVVDLSVVRSKLAEHLEQLHRAQHQRSRRAPHPLRPRSLPATVSHQRPHLRPALRVFPSRFSVVSGHQLELHVLGHGIDPTGIRRELLSPGFVLESVSPPEVASDGTAAVFALKIIRHAATVSAACCIEVWSPFCRPSRTHIDVRFMPKGGQ